MTRRTPRALSMRITARPIGPQPITTAFTLLRLLVEDAVGESDDEHLAVRVLEDVIDCRREEARLPPPTRRRAEDDQVDPAPRCLLDDGMADGARVDGLGMHHDVVLLAKRAGLDPTTFNKSKRVTSAGRARWPSTESVAKALVATGTNVEVFVSLMTDNARRAAQAVPVIGLAEAGAPGFFDDSGFPAGGGWEEIDFPAIDDEHAYGLEISGDSMLPAYRDGDVIIVSPGAPIRRGEPGYADHLDRDGDGIACEPYRGR